MTYPVTPHTRAISTEFFTHIFALFPEDVYQPIVSALAELGIDCLLDFLAEDTEYLMSELKFEDRPLNAKEKRMLKNIHEWVIWESSHRPGIDFNTLKVEDYDKYLTTKFTPKPSPQPAPVTSSYQTPTMSNMMSPFVTNVKLDVKQYPLFNGDTSQWAKFKRGVLALAATHGLDDVFNSKFVVPDLTDFAWSIFNEKNKFVYSIWISRVTSGLALSVLREFEDKKDGRGAYFKFLEIYEGKHNLEQMALLALARLNSISLQYKSPGGVPAFITKFRGALQDLKDANEPVSDAMSKSMLLSKVKDRDYSHIVDILIASSDNFEMCVTRLLDKYNMMNSGNTQPRQNNKVQRGNNRPNNNRNQNNNNRSQGSNSRSNNNNRNKQNSRAPQQKDIPYIHPEDWDKMSKQEQIAIMKKRGTWEEGKKNDSRNDSKTQHPNKTTAGRVQFGPKTTRHIKNMEQSGYDYVEEEFEVEDEAEERPRPTARPSINSIMTSI